jgi:hypothetical protein
MKSPRYSSAALTTTIKCCVAAIFACALLVGFMRTRLTAAEQRNELAAQHIRTGRAHLESVNERRMLIGQYLSAYDRLVHEGALQRFYRAAAGDWFEAAVSGLRVASVDSYVIGKDAPFAGAEAGELTAFRIVSHPLEFTATVANEDEFAELMRSVETKMPGTTAEEACSMTRERDTGQVEPLAVHCTVVWYEFAPPADAALAVNTAGS